MMQLSLRLVPGLWSVFPLPPREFVTHTIATFGAGKCTYRGSDLVLSLPTMDDVVRTARDLFEVLNIEGCIVPRSNCAPIQAIAHDEGEGIEEAWIIAPPGFLMVPGYRNLSQARPWLYDWTIISLAWDEEANALKFPHRSLLLLGPNETECFFCGSHDHASSQCVNCWRVDEAGVTAERLASLPWNRWPEELRKGSSSVRGIQKGINNLREDLRREFKIDYLLGLVASNATTHAELAKYPRITSGELSPLAEAVKRGSKQHLERAVHGVKGKVPDQVFHLFEGMLHVMNDDWEKAVASWWEAENLAHKPVLKAYACLLQMRVHFLKGNKEGAMASAAKGLKADKSATPLKYWNMIIAGLWGQQRLVREYVEGLRSRPRWMAAAMAEPLLMVQAPVVEKVFDKALAYYEKVTNTLVEETDILLDVAEKAFGEGAFQEFRKRFRDWRGKLPDLGYQGLRESGAFFDKFKTELYKEIGKHHKAAIAAMAKSCQAVQQVLHGLPKKRAFMEIIAKCGRFLKECSATVKRYKEYEELAALKGLTGVVERLEEQSRSLVAEANEAVAREWKKLQLKKWAVGGATFVLVVWAVFYIISFLLRF